jgi:hypothetical protein
VRAVTGVSGVDGDGAWGKISRGTWETRQSGLQKRANARGECITLGRLGRESDRLIVAAKRVMTVERRGRSRDVRSERRGEPLG